jgi:hypothetical protein
VGKPRVRTKEFYTEVRANHEDAWMVDAACGSDDPYVYDERYEKLPPGAISCYDGCTVRAQCLTFALNNGFEGIWGGTTYYQRQIVQRRQRRARCPGQDCGGTEIQRGAAKDTCVSCGLSWPTTQPAAA